MLTFLGRFMIIPPQIFLGEEMQTKSALIISKNRGLSREKGGNTRQKFKGKFPPSRNRIRKIHPTYQCPTHQLTYFSKRCTFRVRVTKQDFAMLFCLSYSSQLERRTLSYLGCFC